jgi:hypothetical protein
LSKQLPWQREPWLVGLLWFPATEDPPEIANPARHFLHFREVITGRLMVLQVCFSPRSAMKQGSRSGLWYGCQKEIYYLTMSFADYCPFRQGRNTRPPAITGEKYGKVTGGLQSLPD